MITRFLSHAVVVTGLIAVAAFSPLVRADHFPIQLSATIEAPPDTPPELPSGSANFGRHVSIDGKTALIGVTSSRVAYIYSKDSTGDWIYRARLEFPQPYALIQDVALSGDMALIAAMTPLANGAVFVFRRNGANWNLVQQLTPPVGDTERNFASGIEIDRSAAIVNSPGPRGAVYVYRRDASGLFSLETTLEPNPPVLQGFGASLAIEKDTILVGAPFAAYGSVYVYERRHHEWTLSQQLISTESQDLFGSSLALKDGTAVIGAAWSEFQNPGTTGAVYVYRYSGGVWSEDAKIGRPANTVFGDAVATDGKRVFAVSRGLGGFPGSSNVTQMYVYARKSGTWSVVQTISPAAPPAIQWALDIDISRGTLLTGNQEVVTVDPVFDGQAYTYELRGHDSQ